MTPSDFAAFVQRKGFTHVQTVTDESGRRQIFQRAIKGVPKCLESNSACLVVRVIQEIVPETGSMHERADIEIGGAFERDLWCRLQVSSHDFIDIACKLDDVERKLVAAWSAMRAAPAVTPQREAASGEAKDGAAPRRTNEPRKAAAESPERPPLAARPERAVRSPAAASAGREPDSVMDGYVPPAGFAEVIDAQGAATSAKIRSINDVRFTLGRHQGEPLCDVPTQYLKWALEDMRNMSPHLRVAVTHEVARRSAMRDITPDTGSSPPDYAMDEIPPPPPPRDDAGAQFGGAPLIPPRPSMRRRSP